MKSIYFIVIVVSYIGIGGCSSSKSLQQPKLQTIPDSYGIQNDSSKQLPTDIDWKSYFTNPTLVSLIDTALASNLDLLTSLQRIESSRAYVKYTKGLSRPYVSVNTSVGQKRFGKYTMDGVGNYDTQFSPNITADQIIPEHLPDYAVGLQSSWEVDVWGKLRNKRKAALASYLATVEGRNWVITNLVSEMATQYYALLALDQELTIVKETIVLQENELAIMQIRKEAGRTNELAVKQFEAQVLNSKSMEVELNQQIIECENKINFLIGRFPQSITRDKSSFIHILPAQLKTGVPSDLLRNRPDIKQAEWELTASKANVKAAKAAFYPSLVINGTGGFQSFNPAYLLSPQSLAYSVLGGISAPLLNTSAIKANFRSAKASELEALYTYQKSILNGYVEVYNQMANVKNLEQIYQLKNEEVTILTNAIQTSSELYQTGRATYLEIIITRKNALQANLALIEIKQRQYNAMVNLYRALGGGWK